MNDVSERIWANGLGVYGEVDHGGTEYRRADLPPTLAQAMAVPEVRELVEALQTSNALLGSIPALKNNQRVADAIHANRAALHRIGDTK